MIKKFKIIFVSILLLSAAVSAQAVEISVNSKSQTIGVGEQFEAEFFLDTKEENINAIEGKIVFPAELLELKEIIDGNSVIIFWVEKPKIVSENEISFSGIIPGGCVNRKGLIFSTIFQAKKEGGGIIGIRDERVLQNDGEGTEADTSVSNLHFIVSGKPEVPKMPILKEDIAPPETFNPIIGQDPEMFEGNYFLVFATQDKDSGIDHYEVCEGKKECVVAESPYLLENQDLDEEIIVRAIDKRGNGRIAVLPPQKPKPWYEKYLILVIILLIVVSYSVWEILWKKSKR